MRKKQRERVIKQFHDFYYENFDPDFPPSAVCHSFGTYIFFSSIRKYSAIRFKKVILCGSILSRKLDLKPYFENGQIEQLFNDYGGLDGVVGLSPLVIRECGRSGKRGFKNIPDELKTKITQANNYFGHSDYFFPLQMQKNWLPFLVRFSKQFKYDPIILRDEIFERIYLDKSEEIFRFSDVKYYARIDDKGNYYAQYSKKGLNITDQVIDTFSFRTTADSREQADEMGFRAMQSGQAIVPGKIQVDAVQNKTCSFELGKPISPGEELEIFYIFKWRETMVFNTGDTDHFIIKKALNVSISLNFPFTLTGPRFFLVAHGQIVGEQNPRKFIERDGTHSYKLDYINEFDYDGVIFYYEGSNFTKQVIIPKQLKNFKKSLDEISYFTCSPSDIRDVYILEAEIEHGNAASEQTLYNRLSMFPEGFIIAKDKNKLVGYIETLVWNKIVFEKFDDIKDFPLLYDPNGDTLYIIFIGVAAAYRGKGIGQRLLELAKEVGTKFNTNRMQLVAKDGLEGYYQSFDFQSEKNLPAFLPGADSSTLMNK
ncbi:GNAT family N-acetyltransferase [Pedobacter agri]|uniref:GNAT family N-acetyltransferase n=1 Tax=Pedobacter agri TaxID=454586 RepID=UPI00292DF12B|nr:GNAT family N-acetyltransferase [Pedobacter agri]